jgi:hypothetical protein
VPANFQRLQTRKIAVPSNYDASRFEPAFGKRGLQEFHHRTFDSRIGVAPMFRRAPISGPCFAYSVPAGKSDSAVDHQNSPVAPIIVAQQFPRKNDPFSFDTMKVFHLTSGVLHRCDDIGGRFIRSEAVEENIDLYACSATFGKSLRQLVRYRAVFVKILCERDRGLRTSYLAQHTGKSFIAVEQNFDPVPADDRCFGIGFNGRKKSLFSEDDLWNLAYGENVGATQNQKDHKYPIELSYHLFQKLHLIRSTATRESLGTVSLSDSSRFPSQRRLDTGESRHVASRAGEAINQPKCNRISHT